MDLAASIRQLGALIGQFVSLFHNNQSVDLLVSANVVVWGLHLVVRRELRRAAVPVETSASPPTIKF